MHKPTFDISCMLPPGFPRRHPHATHWHHETLSESGQHVCVWTVSLSIMRRTDDSRDALVLCTFTRPIFRPTNTVSCSNNLPSLHPLGSSLAGSVSWRLRPHAATGPSRAAFSSAASSSSLMRCCLLSASFSVQHVEPVPVRLAQNATRCIPHVVPTAGANVCQC